jgi:hypothetical protein
MGHAHTPPELPEIVDEAGDSPSWLPWLGVGLFVLAGLGIFLCHGEGHSAAADDAVQEPAAADAPAAE